MLAISLEGRQGPLYVQLYRSIKDSILSGAVGHGEKLPSKRKLAEHLGISVNTVVSAYTQLMDEGYLEAREKSGYYVRRADWIFAQQAPRRLPEVVAERQQARDGVLDLKTNAVDTDGFPFSTWIKLLRESLREEKSALLELGHPQGNFRLRQEIAAYLHDFRNMEVSPQQIVLGAGIEYLLGMILDILQDAVFALEDPCYMKVAQILRNRRIPFEGISMDSQGMRADVLKKSRANIVYTTPSRHFPLGTVMGASRRLQLIEWARQAEGRYLIEDDYDFEYRYKLRQIPALYSMNHGEKTLYLNTFARTLAPSFRIAYMVLPADLLQRYHDVLKAPSCTVSTFEQSVLRRFLQDGYYERHLNRMRTMYRERRDAFVAALAPLQPDFIIRGDEAGLHFLVTSLRGMTEERMIQRAEQAGVRVYGLSGYYLHDAGETHTVLMGYGGLCKDKLVQAAGRLVLAWRA